MPRNAIIIHRGDDNTGDTTRKQEPPDILAIHSQVITFKVPC